MSPAVEPRPLGELLDAVAGFFRRWVVFQYPEQAAVCALWTLHAWLFRAFDYTPYLFVFSAEKRSGKTRVLEVSELLSPNATLTESGSSAALIRSIGEDENKLPTLLLDEVDAVYSKNKKGDAEAENLRQFLNAGYRRGGKFLRCVGQGANLEPKKLPAFCPKALSGIDRCLPDTVQDRSLPIHLVRQSREERAERFRQREAERMVSDLVAELKTLAQQQGLIDELRDSRPALPDELSDRGQDITEPLIAIADRAGGKWPGKARAALVKICGQEEDASYGVKLLTDLKRIFDETGADRLPTIDILHGLVAIEDDRPWAAWWLDDLKHDKSQKPAARLAKMLKRYETKDRPIKARVIRVGNQTPRGYERTELEPAWKRYLPAVSSKAATGATSATYEGKNVAPLINVAASSEKDEALPGTKDSRNVAAVVPKAATRFYEGKSPNVAAVAAVAPLPERDGKESKTAEMEDVCTGMTNPDCRCKRCEDFRQGKTIFPGDVLWFRDAADFTAFYGGEHPLPENCIGLEDSEFRSEHEAVLDTLSCTSTLPGSKRPARVTDEPDGFYYHRTRHVARCTDCQSAEWIAQGFEVVNGFPWGDWDMTAAERIAEHDKAALERLERERAWVARENARWQALQAQQSATMTPGEFIAEATRLFNATPSADSTTD